MTTAHSIVRRHGGHIRLQSQPDTETTVRVYLPATDQAPSSVRPASEPGLRRFSGRALVMDDEPLVAQMARALLTDFGFEVEVVGDGAAALMLYEKRMKEGRGFDVALLDLTVAGGMGGKETMRRLLQLDPDARAIVSTGYANDDLIREYRSHGFRGALAKPYRMRQLAELLGRVLDESAD